LQQAVDVTATARIITHSHAALQQSNAKVLHTEESLDRSTGRSKSTFEVSYDNNTFIRLGGGICRKGNSSCFPRWSAQPAGTKEEAQAACAEIETCIAFDVDASVDGKSAYNLYYSDDGSSWGYFHERASTCGATSIDKADPIVGPQMDCYKRKPSDTVITYRERADDGFLAFLKAVFDGVVGVARGVYNFLAEFWLLLALPLVGVGLGLAVVAFKAKDAWQR